MLIPLRPSTLNSFPAMPGVCFILSPTAATHAMPVSICAAFIAPSAISRANSLSSSWQARGASAGVIQIEVLVSEAVCATINTLMPPSASVVKMRRFTPITPTIAEPLTVTMLISFTEDMPRMGRSDCAASFEMTVPSASGLKVFFTIMGIFFRHTG